MLKMDLLEMMPWGREEVEQEREFLSEAWLSTPMLEENNDHSAEMGNELGKIKEDSPQEPETPTQLEEMNSLGSKDSFTKWMEMNDMELAMYQQSAVRQDVLKGYTEGCDWESSNSSIADTTQALLQEFETVCEVYHDALTPPHSRTPSPSPPSVYVHPHFTQQLQAPLAATQPVQDPPTISEPVDLAQELDAMLDEIIRDRAASLDSVNPSAAPKDYNAAPEEPLNLFGINVNTLPAATVKITVPTAVVCNQIIEELIVPYAEIPRVKVEVVSPALSPVSLQEVPSSAERFPSPMSYLSPSSVAPSSPSSPRPNTPGSSTCEEGKEASDPEWVPTKVAPVMKNTPKRQRAKPYARNTKILSSGYSSSERSEMSIELSKPRGRRAPRVRGSLGRDDRKERKKEQNKNAATKYRQKKKAEAEVVIVEEKEMEEKNNELRTKAADLAKEVSYLKKLMREMFKARGMLK